MFLFSLTVCYGQTSLDIDSLNQLLLETPDISKKIEVYSLLSEKYHIIDLEKAKKFANKGLELSITTGINIHNGDLYRSLGDIAIKQDRMDLGEEYYLKALSCFKIQDQHENLVMVMNVLGNIQFMQNCYAEAMNYYLDGIEIAEEYNFEEFLPHFYHNIGAINVSSQHNYADAIKNFSIALDLFKALYDSLNIANVYSNLGTTYAMLNDTILSLTYHRKAREEYIKLDNTDGVARANLGIAVILGSSGKYEEAIELIFSAIEFAERKNKYYTAPPSTLLSKCYNALGENYYLLNEYDKSLMYYKKAYKIGHNNKQINVLSEASNGMSKIWDAWNKTDSAYYYFKIYKTYSDSLINEKNIKKLAFLNAQFKYEQRLNAERQERIRDEEKDRLNYLILALVIAGLVLVIAVMLLWLKLWKNRLKHSELKQNSLKNELDTRNKELTTHVMYQVRKNEFILNITKKLQACVYRLKAENRNLIEDIIKDLERDPVDNSWKDFEVRFHRVHADFNKKLLKKFPELTANELRLCAFLRLNMNTKEIATITYQSANSIDTARSRLRQKIELGKDDNLVAYLMQF